jgi:hypothetical protein
MAKIECVDDQHFNFRTFHANSYSYMDNLTSFLNILKYLQHFQNFRFDFEIHLFYYLKSFVFCNSKEIFKKRILNSLDYQF